MNAPAEPVGAALNIPGSVGELFDKIAILEIKAARIRDPAKLSNVERELALLRGLESRFPAPGDEQARWFAELRQVNAALWDVEDAIRDCERRQDFGESFIALARSVYKTNDRRAEIKRQINRLHNSAIVEEKSYGG